MPIATLDSTRAAQAAPSPLMEATVSDPPMTAAGWLRVEVDAQPGIVKEVPWLPRLDLPVSPGDAVAVIESDEGNYWAVGWWGQAGLTPTPPAGGGAQTLSGEWRWTTSTTAVAAQQVGINTAAWNTATTLRISKTTDAGADASNVLAALQSGDSVYLQDKDDSTRWARYTLGAMTDGGAFVSFPLTFVKGSAALPPNNAPTVVAFTAGGGGGGAALPALAAGQSWVGPSTTPTDIATQTELDAEQTARVNADNAEATARAAADANLVPLTDPRLTNARTPTAHHATHEAGGSDVVAGLLPAGGTAGQVLQKNSATSFDTVWGAPGGTAEVDVSTGGPSPRVGQLLWLDTDEVAPSAPSAPALVTTLPSYPYDGQEVYYRFTPNAVPANAIPIIWHLRWDGPTAKWYPVGEQLPLQAFYGPGASTSMGSGSWGTYDANDPRVTIPLAGVYDIETGASEAYGGVAINFNVGIGIQGAVIADREGGAASTTAGWPVTAYANARGQSLNANDLIRQYYFLSTAGPQNVVMRGRYILVRPRRIG